jgi:hypothetical protein
MDLAAFDIMRRTSASEASADARMRPCRRLDKQAAHTREPTIEESDLVKEASARWPNATYTSKSHVALTKSKE